MRARFVNENTFERGRSVKATLGLGKRALIKKWFDDLGKSSNEYVINDDFSIDYKSDLYLENTNITELPDNLTVKGSLDLVNTKITKLPDNLKVNGYLSLANTNITKLPDNLTVNDGLYLDNTKVSRLPDNLNVKYDIYISKNMKLTYVPEHLKNKVKNL